VDSNGFTVRQSKSQSGKIELVVGKSYQDVVLADSPVAYWRLGDRTGTTAKDISGSGFDGIYTNGPTLGAVGAISGDGDTATGFDGSDDYVAVANGFTNTIKGDDTHTVEMWVYANSVGGKIPIASTSNSYYIQFDSNQVFWAVASGAYRAYNPFTLTLNQWHHLVLIKTGAGNSGEFYLDNVLQTSFIGTLSSTANVDQGFVIGQYSSGYNWNGYIDEVAIYNTALSASQVSVHYNAKLATYGGVCYSTSTFSNSAWNFLGGLFDGSTAKLFVNGRQECSATVSAGFTTPAGNLVAASSSTSSQANAWSGSIADLKVYGTSDGSSVGSSTDINTNFTATADRFRETPVGNIVTSGIVLNLDAANASRGLTKYANGCAASDLSWFDLSASALTGTLTNFASCGASSGWNGAGTAADPYRLTFDGTNDDVRLGSMTRTLPLTLEMWVKPATASPLGIYDSGPATANTLRIYPAGTIDWHAGTPTAALGLTANAWVHLAIIYSHDGTNRIITWYKNGAAQATASAVGTSTISWTTLQLGSLNSGVVGNYQGDMAKFAVYNKALSASEVSQNCNALKARFSGATCN